MFLQVKAEQVGYMEGFPGSKLRLSLGLKEENTPCVGDSLDLRGVGRVIWPLRVGHRYDP